MTLFQHKLILLQQNYYKIRERLYCQELKSTYVGIVLKQDKIWRSITFIYRTCSYCQEVYRQYYAVIQHQTWKSQLCLKCTYDLLINKHLKCIFSYEKDKKNDTKTSNHQNNSENIMQNQLQNSKRHKVNNFTQDDILNIPNFQLQMNPDIKLQYQATENYRQEQLALYKNHTQDPIIFRLTNQYNLNQFHQPLNIRKITIITSSNVQQINKPKPAIQKLKPFIPRQQNQLNYLTYFFKNILSKTIIKTYKQQDKVSKNQIRYLYEYWIKYVKIYLQDKGITLKQFINRPVQQYKKLLEGDRRLSELNHNSHEYYQGLQKKAIPWNQLVSNLKNKNFNFEDLPCQVQCKFKKTE